MDNITDFVVSPNVKIPDLALQLIGLLMLVGFAERAAAAFLVLVNFAHQEKLKGVILLSHRQ